MSWWNSLYFVAAAVGSFASSWLSDRLFRNNRRVMIVVCFAGVIPFVFLLASLQTASAGLLALALCGMGFFVNCCGYVAAAFATKIFSALVIVRDGTKDYTPGWTFIAVCAILGTVAACFIRTKANA